MRSDAVKKGFERTPHRSLLKACGLKNEDMGKPFIAVANSFCEIVPGHVHLNKVGEIVKQAIRDAGGVPFEFNTIAVCDGVAMGHGGMRYSLASRELIADAVETMIMAHQFDGMVCIPNCDKVVPGMLMASVRCNIPTIFASGGPMAAGKQANGAPADLISVFEGIGKFNAGQMTEEELSKLEDVACPTCGSCSGMFTANSMNCLCEAIGIALPGNGTILAGQTDALNPERIKLFQEAGRRIVDLVKKDIKPRDIVTNKSIRNALVLDMAMGGSTNTILHTLALAGEAGLDFDLNTINAISQTTPHICKVSPSCNYHMEDVDSAGGISAILKEISKVKGALDLSCPTVTGKTLGENIASADIKDEAVIHKLDNAYSQQGGLFVLRGNLAPDGAVIKTAGVDPKMLVYEGKAVIFIHRKNLRRQFCRKSQSRRLVVIRYESQGGRACRNALATSYIWAGIGRQSRAHHRRQIQRWTRGACIDTSAPKRLTVTIGLLQDGDIIAIDMPARKLEVKLSDAELEKRRATFKPLPPKVKTGYLARYAYFASSASTGAIMKLSQ